VEGVENVEVEGEGGGGGGKEGRKEEEEEGRTFFLGEVFNELFDILFLLPMLRRERGEVARLGILKEGSDERRAIDERNGGNK